MKEYTLKLDDTTIDFLEHWQEHELQSSGEAAIAALQNLQLALKAAKLEESATLYAGVHQEDEELQELAEAGLGGISENEGVLDAFDAFRFRIVSEQIDLDSDEIFADVRDRTPTPEKPRWS